MTLKLCVNKIKVLPLLVQLLIVHILMPTEYHKKSSSYYHAEYELINTLWSSLVHQNFIKIYMLVKSKFS